MSARDPRADEQLDRITARFENENAQARRQALWMTLIPVAVGLLVVGSAWLTLANVRDELAGVRGELETAAADLEQARGERDDLVREREELETEIAEKKAELDHVAALLEQGETELARQVAETAETAPRGRAQPRVYIHLSASGQLPVAQAFAAELRKQGFVVPKEEILIDRAPSKNQVRVFRRADREQGQAIARLLRAEGVENVEVNYIGGFEDSKALKPGHFEIWLSASGTTSGGG